MWNCAGSSTAWLHSTNWKQWHNTKYIMSLRLFKSILFKIETMYVFSMEMTGKIQRRNWSICRTSQLPRTYDSRHSPLQVLCLNIHTISHTQTHTISYDITTSSLTLNIWDCFLLTSLCSNKSNSCSCGWRSNTTFGFGAFFGWSVQSKILWEFFSNSSDSSE